jgi:hypothetical protein
VVSSWLRAVYKASAKSSSTLFCSGVGFVKVDDKWFEVIGDVNFWEEKVLRAVFPA